MTDALPYHEEADVSQNILSGILSGILSFYTSDGAKAIWKGIPSLVREVPRFHFESSSFQPIFVLAWNFAGLTNLIDNSSPYTAIACKLLVTGKKGDTLPS